MVMAGIYVARNLECGQLGEYWTGIFGNTFMFMIVMIPQFFIFFRCTLDGAH